VVEMLMGSPNDPGPGKPFDILMLLNQPGGRIRTEAEFRALFGAAGLRLTRVIPTASPNSILEGVRVGAEASDVMDRRPTRLVAQPANRSQPRPS